MLDHLSVDVINAICRLTIAIARLADTPDVNEIFFARLNPQLVDEQIRGGIVQGIGGVLYENCLYDADGQMLNATMMDYLVPMAGEMPDIDIGHVVTPTADSELGAKGAGEAGTAGAPACIMNAINDALRPLGAAPITAMPITPERVLAALRGDGTRQ